MNVITDTAAGPRVLTPHEAQMRIDQLWKLIASYTLNAANETHRAAALAKEISQLEPVAHPENAYNEWIPK